MVEMKNNCDSCVHKSVCKYSGAFKKSIDDIEKFVNDNFRVCDIDYDMLNMNSGLIDFTIRCREYVMAPYQEVKSKQNDRLQTYCYDPLLKTDLEKMQKHCWEFPKPDFMKTSVDMQEEK